MTVIKKIKHYIGLFVLPVICLLTLPAALAVSIEDFSINPQYGNATLSPDGKHLALTYDNGEQTRLYFFSLPDLKLVGNHGLAGDTPGQIFWANNERVVVKVLRDSIRVESKAYFGELYAVNYDGSEGKFIFGYRTKSPSTRYSKRSSKKSRAWAFVIDMLKNDDEHILIYTHDWSDGFNYPEIKKLNIYRGRMNEIAKSPKKGAQFRTDQNGEIKLAYATDSHREKYLFRKDPKGGWSEISNISFGRNFHVLSVVDDEFYAFNNHKNNTTGLYKYNLNTGSETLLFRDKQLDISQAIIDRRSNHVIALKTYPDYPAYQLLHPSAEASKSFKYLAEKFLGASISLASQSANGKQWLARVSTDTSPGTYILYNTQSKQLRPLLTMAKHLNPSDMSMMEPFSFTSSDDQKIRGYITYPKNSQKTKHPLVVLVHGGPHGVRDIWTFNKEVQLLASQGFAVIQVNFRGSGGYGQKFMKAGFLNWGTKIQQDIYEAAQWAIQQDKVDAQKVCIMGASFGGYSAVQSMIKYPDFYNCAVANVGVYDLNLLDKEGVYKNSYASRLTFRDYVGTDPKRLNEQSPVFHTDKIKGPILIAHGVRDEIAPIEHAEALKQAMDDNNKKYEWLVFKNEEHGLRSLEKRSRYYKKLIAFLKSNI